MTEHTFDPDEGWDPGGGVARSRPPGSGHPPDAGHRSDPDHTPGPANASDLDRATEPGPGVVADPALDAGRGAGADPGPDPADGDAEVLVVRGLSAGQVGVVEAFARLVAADATTATTGELRDAVGDVVAVESVLAGCSHEWLRRWEASGDWRAERARSAGSWLASNSEWSSERARSCLRTARDLRHLPTTSVLARAGRLGPEKVRLLAGCRTPVVRTLFDAQETELATTVEGLTVSAARLYLRQWLLWAQAHVDPDGPEPSMTPAR